MLIDEYNPARSLYYIGAVTLSLTRPESSVDVVVLYRRLQRKIGKITFARYMLALDWLFIANLIQADEHGDLSRCS
jgi:hypothetical protein